jgi:hypothetical protein
MDTKQWITTMNAVEEFVEWINEHGDKPEGYIYRVDTPGKRFVRIVMVPRGVSGTSVHAFVDIANGDLLKAASWKAPAKGARGNLLDGMDDVKARWNWAGGYLYR